jgi:hypothetical protein
MESKLRLIIGVCLWSLYWLFIFGMVSVTVHGWPGWVLGFWLASIIVAALALVWRLPSKVRFVAVVVEVFVLACGVNVAHFFVEDARQRAHVEATDAVHKTRAWTEATDALTMAKATRQSWADKAAALDPTWVTSAKKLAEEYDKADHAVGAAASALDNLEAHAPPVPGTGSPFEVFGPENAPAVTGWFLLIFGVAVGGLALALMWVPLGEGKTQASPVKVAEPTQFEKDEDLYMMTAKAHPTGDRIAGYKKVAKLLNKTEAWGKSTRVRLVLKKRIDGPLDPDQ